LFDEKNKIKIANDFFCTLFNLAKEKVEGLTEEKFKLLIKDKVRVLSIKQDKKKEKKYIEISVGNGIKHILLITERSLDIAAGTVTGKIVGYEDVTKEYQATVDSYNLAITDPLTGTYNRRHQRDVVAELINKGQPFVLGAIDLDNLKQVNDNYGHATGDIFIKSAIKFLLKKLSSDDVVCRVGGDEFIVAFVGKTKENCEKILAQTNTELENAGFVFPASLSYGVVSLDKITFSAYRKALKEADIALYDMKKNKKIER
jgi:diguanylate cyclase (GGDEF)-like protein